MRTPILAALAVLLGSACGREESVTPREPASITASPIDVRAQAAVALYERTSGVSTRSLQELYFMPAVVMGEYHGRCDAYWEGSKLTIRVILSEDTLNWSQLRFNLLVAHELEHCVRGASHPEDEQSPHLMRRWMLSEEEAKAKSYEQWVKESLATRPAGRSEEL